MRPGMQDRLSATLARGRAMAEARMRATCEIDRPIPGEHDVDEDGRVVPKVERIYPDPAWAENHPHADGKCYVRYPGLAHEAVRDSVGVRVVESRVIVRLPFGPRFRPGDVVTILSDRDNPQLAGAKLRVASIDDQSQATAQRLLCEDFQSGGAA